MKVKAEKAQITKKAQVIVIAKEFSRHWVLLLQMAEARGGHWQNVTGSAEKNESFEEGGVRELREETGIKVKHLVPLDFEFSYNDRWGRKVREQAFLAQLNDIPEISISREHQTYLWQQIDGVKENAYAFASNFEAFTLAVQKLVP